MISLFDRVNSTYKSYVDYPREFLIIYKTNNEKEFVLEGYHENDDDKYFEFLKMPKESSTFLVNYYTFKMTENYEFIGTNNPRNLKDTGILRIKYGEEKINFFEKKYSYEEAEQGNYKINTGVSEGNKATIYKYFINKKNKEFEKNECFDKNLAKNFYETRIRLTKKGMLLANNVFVEFI